MATKQEIIAKQKSVYTENPDLTDWDEVEETFNTDYASIVDNFYGLKTFDYDRASGTTSNVVTSTSNFEYEADITKNGTRVDITGTLVNVSGVLIPSSTSVFDITDSEYLMQSTNNNAVYTYSVYCKGVVVNNSDVSLQLINNTLRVLDVIPINVFIKFSLTYNTDN